MLLYLRSTKCARIVLVMFDDSQDTCMHPYSEEVHGFGEYLRIIPLPYYVHVPAIIIIQVCC